MTSLSYAIDLYRHGNTLEAEAECKRLLAVSNDNADALMLLAEIQVSAGHVAKAIPTLTSLIRLRPRDAVNHCRLGEALLFGGRPSDAVEALRLAIDIEPRITRAHNNLGQALMQIDQIDEAIQSYEQALRLDPNYAIAHNNLGLAFTAAGKFDAAAQSLQRALALDATRVIAHTNLAIVFQKQNRLADALQAYDRALALSPTQFDAWIGRGMILSKQSRFQSALESLGEALRLRPGDAMTLARKASALLSIDRATDALNCAEDALRSQADLVEAHDVKGSALRTLGRLSDALRSFDQALELNPGYVWSWCNRAIVLQNMGDHGAAATSYRRALSLDPECVRARTCLLSALIPSVPSSPEESIEGRKALDVALSSFESWLSGKRLDEDDAITAARQQFFYLSYQEKSNRGLLQRYRHAIATRLPRFDEIAQGSGVLSDASRRRFKLGIVSAHIHDHSVFNAIVKGWLKRLDHAAFEITIFSVGKKQDELTRTASAAVDHFEVGTRTTLDWARTIKNRNLDALIFPEVGMDETALALASMRLAGRQLAAWGHPETSGLPTIDYYLSAELFEPVDAEEHYSERLVRLPNLGVYYQPFAIPSAPVDFAELAIPTGAPVFVCPGVPFKYRPQDDHVLVDIARRIGRCTFVFFKHEKVELSNKLNARISAAFGAAKLDASQYLVWLPWQPRSAFVNLMRQADIYLDTIGFSGFNTVMLGVEAHIPCVTYEGRFMRGRFGSAIMRRLEIPELVASDTTNYVDIAVALAESSDYRSGLRNRMSAAEHSLYADVPAVDALATRLIESRHVDSA
jgi:protein O-GlcNAc transferase